MPTYVKQNTPKPSCFYELRLTNQDFNVLGVLNKADLWLQYLDINPVHTEEGAVTIPSVCILLSSGKQLVRLYVHRLASFNDPPSDGTPCQ